MGCGCGGSGDSSGSEGGRLTTAPDGGIGPGSTGFYWEGPEQAPKEGEVRDREPDTREVEATPVVEEVEPVVEEQLASPVAPKRAKAKRSSAARKKTG